MIATEEWHKNCKRWKFFFGFKNLEPDDVFNSDEDLFKITHVKIDLRTFLSYHLMSF
jgi:hypothetical protein